MLGGRDPIIRRADLGQIGGWYRVQVGPFATSEQATVLCNSLKAAGGQCIVQEDTPQPVSVEPRVRDRKEAEPEHAPPGQTAPPQPALTTHTPTDFANEPKKVKTLTVRHDADCAAMAARTPAVKAGGGAFVVQVSAQKTEDEARASYQVLQQKFPCVLGGRDPIIRRAELGQSGTWYRVHVGSFATSEQATAFCTNLKDAGGQCIVQKN